MNRYEFMQELKIRLQRLPYDEISNAINYYEEYFDDAGVENEQSVIAELGSPANVASQIIADFVVKDIKTSEPPSARKGLSTVWLIILAIFASPIALPFAFAIVMVIFALVIVLFSFAIVGVALGVSGIVCFIVSITLIIRHFPTAIFYMGTGLVSFGVGIVVTILFVNLSRKCFGWLANRLSNFIRRRNKR